MAKLTDDDVKPIGDKKDILIGVFKKPYGHARDAAEREIDSFIEHLRRPDDSITSRSRSARRSTSHQFEEKRMMRKLALVVAAVVTISFAGSAHADDKTERSEKTDTSTTLTGAKKTKKTKKVEKADGTGTETTTETTTPKADGKAHGDGTADATVKSDNSTTITGKKKHKVTKKVDNGDGSSTETTTTTTTK